MGLRFIIAVAALLIPSLGFAQDWQVFVDRERQFTIAFPGTPEIADATYVTQKGTRLPSRVYSATAGTARYMLTVVEFASAPDEESAELTEAARVLMAKGVGKEDKTAYQDGLIGHHITIVEPNGRRLWGAVHSFEHRLYIVEGSDAPTAPPPAMFTHSLIITHKDGQQINLDCYSTPFNAFDVAK